MHMHINPYPYAYQSIYQLRSLSRSIQDEIDINTDKMTSNDNWPICSLAKGLFSTPRMSKKPRIRAPGPDPAFSEEL